MAVDTRNKRASVLGLAMAVTLVLPAPDGALDAEDRQQVALSYASLAAAAVAPGVGYVVSVRQVIEVPPVLARGVLVAAPARVSGLGTVEWPAAVDEDWLWLM